MNPKFSIGEQVILQSLVQPESNGEYEIQSILFYNDTIDDRLDESYVLICAGDVGYLFTEPLKETGFSNEVIWAESALRKKHEPSQLSFNSLMDNLKLPQKA